MMDYVDRLRKADRPDLAELLQNAWRHAAVICAEEHPDSPEPVSAETQIYFRTIEEDLLAAQDPASSRFREDCD